jgi:ubiquinone/menaquinone biosynthesis C-methylase UbiE
VVEPEPRQKDWVAWHRDYEDPQSALSRRLEEVRGQIRRALPDAPARVLSICAGQGDDLLPVLRDHRAPVTGRLVELDPHNAAELRARVAAAGLSLEVVQGDAGELSAYEGAVPADLVLACGVFGNVSDDDIRRTVSALPQLCRQGATVIWTRHRRPPDLTPSIRGWLREAGFAELEFVAPDDVLWSVGVDRFDGTTAPLSRGRIFSFYCR